MHSRMFETIKKYYEEGLWGIAKLRYAVTDEFITPAEYAEITGEEYPEPNND